MVTAPAIFLMICSSVCDFLKIVFMLFCSSHLANTRKCSKNTHTHTNTTMFFFEKSWAKFFLKPFFFVNRPHLKKFVEFYFAKTNSAKIYIFLNIIFRKNIFLSGDTKILVSCMEISVSGSSAFYLSNV